MSMFRNLGNGNRMPTATPQQQNQSNALYNEFKQSPTDFLMRMGLNIPQDFNGDYRALVEHLNATGQIPRPLQGRVNAMLGRR